MLVMVGYPDAWRDYGAVAIDAGRSVRQRQRAGRFNAAHEMAKVGKPVDRKEWFMNPQTVNAYNGGQ